MPLDPSGSFVLGTDQADANQENPLGPIELHESAVIGTLVPLSVRVLGQLSPLLTECPSRLTCWCEISELWSKTQSWMMPPTSSPGSGAPNCVKSKKSPFDGRDAAWRTFAHRTCVQQATVNRVVSESYGNRVLGAIEGEVCGLRSLSRKDGR